MAKWYSVVYLVLAYLSWRKYEHERVHGGTATLPDVLQAARREHLRACPRQACTEVSHGAAIADVWVRDLGPEEPAA
jgi:hypothetical protein